MKNKKPNIKYNKALTILRTFSSQKNYHNRTSIQNSLLKPKNKNNIRKINNKNNKNNNNEYFDNLSEKVLNLYDFVDTIKSEHKKEYIMSNSNTKHNYISYLNNYINKKQNKNIEIDNLNINKNNFSVNILNNPSYQKIIYNKNNNNYLNEHNSKKQNIKKNRNIINCVTPKNNNLFNENDFSSLNNHLDDKNDRTYIRNDKFISNYKLNFKNRNPKLNKSPVGRFDNYFYNSNYKLDKKKLLNNQICFTNSTDKDRNKNLRIESPTSLSYHSFLKKNSPREMSIEHNIEYDINSKKYQKYSMNKFNRYKIIGITQYKNDNSDLNKKNDNKKYKTINYNTNSLLNKCKFKSETISQLIKDYYLKKNDNQNNEEKSSSIINNYLKTNNNNFRKYKTTLNNDNKLIDKKINSKIKTINKNKLNNNLSKKIKKIIKNDMEIIIEYNNENNIENLILNDKKGKQINFIPNNITYNNYNTIDNSINTMKNKEKILRDYKKNDDGLLENSEDKNISYKNIVNEHIIYNRNLGENIKHSIDISLSKNRINHNINKRKVKNNNIQKNNNKVHNDLKNLLIQDNIMK